MATPSRSRHAALAVASVRVWLTIVRGGETRADGIRVPAKGGWVDGVVEYRLSRPAREGDRLVLLDFTGAMPQEPLQLDEVKLGGYVPGGPYDDASVSLTGQWGVRSVRRQGERRDIVVVPEPGATTITLRYGIDVPKRYWPMGCLHRRCSLSGAIAPLPSVPAQGGRYLPRDGRVVAPVPWTVERAAFVTSGKLRPGAPVGARPMRRPDEVVVVGGDGQRTQYPSVFWGPKWYRVTEIRRGVTVEVLHTTKRPSGRVPDETFVQLRRDLPGQVVEIARELVDLLGVTFRAPPPDSRLTVVQGPLRSEVAEAHPDVVLVSDEALQLFPADRLLKFHQMAMARAMLDVLVERALRGKHDPSTDLWLSGAVAFGLTGVWRAARDHRDEFAADILRNLTFMPAVDRFLYTQQASFSQSYFRGVEDQPALRNHPLFFANELPTGRRLHEKLLDTLGPDRLAQFYATLSGNPRAHPVRAAERAYGHDLGWFFDQWLGPYPSVNYAVVDVTSQREGAGWRHEVTIEKDGEVSVIEPVQVLVVERGGEAHHLVWNGELGAGGEDLGDEPIAGRHSWTLRTDDKLKSVRIDPRARLLQTPQAPRANVDPRFDDRDPPQFRFLYTGVGFSFAASEFVNAATPAARFNAVSGFASFEASLRRDLRRTGHVQIFRDRETHVGGGAGTNLWFGRKVNNQRRRSRVRLFATAAYLNASSLDPRGGVRLSERVSLIDDTRRFGWWPERGRLLSVAVAARHTVRDQEPVHDLTAGASWIHLWRLAHDHVIASALSMSAIAPVKGRPEFRGLLRAGGIGGLSGYAADEVFGLGLAVAQLEYRHVYISDLHLNFAHLWWLRTVGGVLFTGVASSSQCESLRGWFGRDSYYGHVGYALSAYLSVLGVTPQLLKVDASVPLVRRTGVMCLDQVLPDYLAEVQGLQDAERLLPPFNVNVTFNQSF